MTEPSNVPEQWEHSMLAPFNQEVEDADDLDLIEGITDDEIVVED